jgi:hypothetical protein
MENQKTHRRKITVALFVGMFLAAPPLSLTAEAQMATPQERAQWQRERLRQGLPYHLTPQMRQFRNNCMSNGVSEKVCTERAVSTLRR